jgi:hypothetical protein
MTAATADKVLLPPKLNPGNPVAGTLLEVSKKFGVRPMKQLREMMGLHFGLTRLDFSEYYDVQAYRPDMPESRKKEFAGARGSMLLNNRLSPVKLTDRRSFVRDKILYASLLEARGFETTHTQAVVSTTRRFGNIPTLSDAGSIEAFLREKACFPLFGKPEEGSGSVGSALFSGIDKEAGRLHLASGRSVGIGEFAREVLEDYPEGFIFQTAIKQHPAVVEVIGDVVGTIRAVTVFGDAGPEVLYCLWKIPSPEAMSDNFWQAGSMIAEVDRESGIVGECRTGSGLGARLAEVHPVTARAITGFAIPHWAEMCETVRAAHHLLPEFGIFGWDIALGPDGQIIIECNANPHHMLYQLATARGILNPDFTPVFERVETRAAALLKAKIEKKKQAVRDARKTESRA